jgi:hypothetical protein
MKRENTKNSRSSNRYKNEFKSVCSLHVIRDNLFRDKNCNDDGGDIENYCDCDSDGKCNPLKSI